MAREIIKHSYNTYEEISPVLESIDISWNSLKTWDKFLFCKHPYNIYYINSLSDSIENIKGPYKIFDIHGNTLQVERTNKSFKASTDLIKCGPVITYLKTNNNNLYMLFISRNSITSPYIEPEIRINRPSKSSISINNTTQQSIYYSYTSSPIEPTSLIEIKAGVIEILQPTSANYLFIRTDLGPVAITSNNTRTRVVNNYFLLVCPTNYSKAQTAKLTSNPISTITDQLDIFITV